MPLIAILQSMRPRQWTKNLVLFAAVIFSLHLFDRELVLRAVAGFATFCVLSGVVYMLNDLKDREQDALHPRKKNRPIASGALSPPVAWGALVVLFSVGLFAASRLGTNFLIVSVAYVTLNILYSFVLRNMVILDVMGISTGFVLRAIAGGEAISTPESRVDISAWLLMCTFFLSLFLGLGKRRHELMAVGSSHRASLRNYSIQLVDRLTAITVAVTIMSYSIYTIWPDTVAHFGTENLIYTIPFVFFGLSRYIYLVVEEDKGGDPSEMLLSDRSILATVVLWILCVAWILYARN